MTEYSNMEVIIVWECASAHIHTLTDIQYTINKTHLFMTQQARLDLANMHKGWTGQPHIDFVLLYENIISKYEL